MQQSRSTLSWSGDLPVGSTATLTYQVKVADDVNEGDDLVNVVTGSGEVAPGVTPPTPKCVPDTASENPDCTTTHTPEAPTPPTTPPTTPSTTPPTSTAPVTPSRATTPPSTPSTTTPGVSVHTGGSTSGGIALKAGLGITLLGLLGLVILWIRRRRFET
ncbi:DUF7927 domain-containing protein [Brachybacterium huguangmaarense]